MIGSGATAATLIPALADNVDSDALLERILGAIPLPKVTPNHGNVVRSPSY